MFIPDTTRPLCPCGRTEIDATVRLDHDDRAECCPGFCHPATCECQSVMVDAIATHFACDGCAGEAEGAGVARMCADCGGGILAGEGYPGSMCRGCFQRLMEARYPLDASNVPIVTDTSAWRSAPVLTDASDGCERVECCQRLVCACGIVRDRAAFDALPLPASGRDRQDDGEGGVLILRNCSCGSTVARHGDRDERDAFEVAQLAADAEFDRVCDARTRGVVEHMERAALASVRSDAARLQPLGSLSPV